MSNKDLILIFPDTKNGNLLYEAVSMAIEDDEFMETDDQVKKTAEIIIPKGTLSATFKRLQKNARRDFLDKMDDNVPGYTADTRDTKIKDYVTTRFQSYLDDQKTAKRAKRLFDAAYPTKPKAPVPEEPATE